MLRKKLLIRENIMKNIFFSHLIFLPIISFILSATQTSFAQTISPTPSVCPPVYGGGEICLQAKDFRINKTILHPKSGRYVESLDQKDATISPERTVLFQVTLINTTTRTLRDITITDSLPASLQFVKANPSIKVSGREISYKIASLPAQATTTISLETKVVAEPSFPEGQNVLCTANIIQARLGSQVGGDIVPFCIQKEISQPQLSFPLTTKGGQRIYPAPQAQETPNTGAEALSFSALLLLGILGYLLRKKTKVIREN
jgi:uncharacterized repeat protein (TIGR01451 family)/LPXTG-motif cell wall-anchored protein